MRCKILTSLTQNSLHVAKKLIFFLTYFRSTLEAILFHKWRDALEVRVFGNGTRKYSSQIPFLKE
jgi:hypothetical protein